MTVESSGTGTPRSSSARMNTRARIAGLLAAALALGLLLGLGPRAVSIPEESTGDAELAAFLRDHAPRGAGNITAFVVQGDKVRFAGLGVDENYEHEIGSVTKIMVAELLHDAVEGGSLSATTKAGEILGVPAPVSDVTLRELAEHTSGLPRLSSVGVLGWARSLVGSDPYAGITADDVVSQALAADLTGRGEQEYSNFGFALLGQLLARSAGSDFATLARERLFEPLGMESTYVAVEGAVSENAPRGRFDTGRPAAPWASQGYAAAGSVRSTSRDMARFAQHVLTSTREPLTWAETTVGPHEVLWHNGGTGGFSTMLVLHRPTGSAAYVATDTTASVDDLGLDLFAHLHGITPEED